MGPAVVTTTRQGRSDPPRAEHPREEDRSAGPGLGNEQLREPCRGKRSWGNRLLATARDRKFSGFESSLSQVSDEISQPKKKSRVDVGLGAELMEDAQCVGQGGRVSGWHGQRQEARRASAKSSVVLRLGGFSERQ